MLKNTLIIALLLLVIYLYYQQRQNPLGEFTNSNADLTEIAEVKKVNKIFADFCKNEIGGQDINEIRSKLNGRTLSEVLEDLVSAKQENEDYETTVDELKRKKGELEAEVVSLNNAWKNRVSEKERIITRLTTEKQEAENEVSAQQKKVKHKAKLLDTEQLEYKKSLEQTEQLTIQLTTLKQENQKLLAELKPLDELTQQHQEQLRKINLLFDERAKDYPAIEFNGLYELLRKFASHD